MSRAGGGFAKTEIFCIWVSVEFSHTGTGVQYRKLRIYSTNNSQNRRQNCWLSISIWLLDQLLHTVILYLIFIFNSLLSLQLTVIWYHTHFHTAVELYILWNTLSLHIIHHVSTTTLTRAPYTHSGSSFDDCMRQDIQDTSERPGKSEPETRRYCTVYFIFHTEDCRALH